MGLKLYVLGWREYWANQWNALDGTIVIISLVDLLISVIFAELGIKISFLRILRMLRVLRMLRLMREWKVRLLAPVPWLRA